MSTVSDIITGIRDDLKDDGTVPKFSDEKIIRFMNRFRIFLAAILFREQCNLSLKKADIVTTSAVSTYDFMSGSGSDYYADFGIHFSDKTTGLRKRELAEYISGGYGSSTAVGSAGSYMILGTTLYLFGDIPDRTATAWLWYYSIVSSFTATTDTMPYKGLFDEPWRQFVSLLLLNRDEYTANFEAEVLKTVEVDVLRSIVSMSSQPKMIPIKNPGNRRPLTIGNNYYE